MQISHITDEKTKKSISELNLEPIKFKLVNEEKEEKWSLEQADLVEKWYKRFLFLCAKHPNKAIVPNQTIDKFWHQHILDTEKYQKDCEKVFGYLLHHFPYFGIRDKADKENSTIAAQSTKKLYKEYFDENIDDLSIAFNQNISSYTSCRPHPTPIPSCSCSNDFYGVTHNRPMPKRKEAVNLASWY